MVFASVISAIFLAWLMVIVGAVQMIHALSTREWKLSFLDLVIGILYAAVGVIILTNFFSGTIKLTLLIGIIFTVSGLFRFALAQVLWRQVGWFFLISGIIGALAGASFLAEWPQPGLWVLGLCFGIDAIFQGFAWIGYSTSIASEEQNAH